MADKKTEKRSSAPVTHLLNEIQSLFQSNELKRIAVRIK